MEYVGLILILIAGIFNPVQTGVNSTLRHYVQTPILSCTVSFAVGLLTLMILTAINCGGLIPDAGSVSDLPWWAWIGGLMGVIGLTGNILLFPRLGGVLTVLLPMLGQIVTSMMVDTMGGMEVDRIPMGAGRCSGLILVVLGLILYMGRKNGDSHRHIAWPWIVLGVSTGVTFAIQPVMNGRLATALGSSIHAAFLSFAIATAILLVMLVSMRDERRNIPLVFSAGRPWWTWTGGLLGAYYVTAFALVTPIAGAGLVTLTGILGSILCSAVIDSKGLFGRKAQRIRPAQYAGLSLVFLGIICIKLL